MMAKLEEGLTHDPCRPNDRLLLRMKGSISEFELGLRRMTARSSWSRNLGRLSATEKKPRRSRAS